MQEISRAMAAGSLEAIAEQTKEATASLGVITDASKVAAARAKELKQKYGRNAVKVEPYAANRKQRRAQAAAEKAQARATKLKERT